MRSARCCVLLSHRLRRRFAAPAGESAQDAPLRHLQAGRHRRDPGQHVGQSRHIGLHVTQELLQLVQHCWSMSTHALQSRGKRQSVNVNAHCITADGRQPLGEKSQSAGQQFELMDLHPPLQCRCHTESVLMLRMKQQYEMCLYATVCTSLAVHKAELKHLVLSGSNVKVVSKAEFQIADFWQDGKFMYSILESG